MGSAKATLRLVRASEPPPAASSEPEDLDALFRRFAPYVARIGFRILGRKDEVDDLVQDVFLAAASGLSELRDPNAVRAWLATVTVRTAQKRLRASRLRAMLLVEPTRDYEDVADDNASPEERALLTAVYRTLERVPIKERIPWTLRYIEGERLERIALLSGCSLATVKRRIAAAHKRIQEAMSDG